MGRRTERRVSAIAEIKRRQDSARRLLPMLDLTDLTEACDASSIRKLCEAARTPYGDVAAVCLFPPFVALAKATLPASSLKVATVINFPHGGETIAQSTKAARKALDDGADEIDLVMPYRAFLRGEEESASALIRAIADRMPPGRKLKVILETGALGDGSAITRASRLAIDAGANFLKTSTGKIAVSATPAAAQAMLLAIRKSGKTVGFKAAGGIRTLAEATTYLDIADQIMGAEWAWPATFRIGTSSLLAPLIEALDHDEAG